MYSHMHKGSHNGRRSSSRESGTVSSSRAGRSVLHSSHSGGHVGLLSSSGGGPHDSYMSGRSSGRGLGSSLPRRGHSAGDSLLLRQRDAILSQNKSQNDVNTISSTGTEQQEGVWRNRGPSLVGSSSASTFNNRRIIESNTSLAHKSPTGPERKEERIISAKFIETPSVLVMLELLGFAVSSGNNKSSLGAVLSKFPSTKGGQSFPSDIKMLKLPYTAQLSAGLRLRQQWGAQETGLSILYQIDHFNIPKSKTELDNNINEYEKLESLSDLESSHLEAARIIRSLSCCPSSLSLCAQSVFNTCLRFDELRSESEKTIDQISKVEELFEITSQHIQAAQTWQELPSVSELTAEIKSRESKYSDMLIQYQQRQSQLKRSGIEFKCIGLLLEDCINHVSSPLTSIISPPTLEQQCLSGGIISERKEDSSSISSLENINDYLMTDPDSRTS